MPPLGVFGDSARVTSRPDRVATRNVWRGRFARACRAPLRYTVTPPMPLTTRNPDYLLTQLEAAKNRFNPGDAALVARLLAQLSKLSLTNPRQLIRFHECLLFLRAFPHHAALVSRVEHL